MIAADGHWQRPCCQNSTHAGFDVGVAVDGVGMDNVGISDIHDPHIPRQIDGIVLVVIGPCMAKAEQGRSFAHGARSKARTRPPLGAGVERCAQNGNIGVDLRPIADIGSLAKG